MQDWLSHLRTVTTQNNHVFMAIYAVFKLERLKIKHKAQSFRIKNEVDAEGLKNGI